MFTQQPEITTRCDSRYRHVRYGVIFGQAVLSIAIAVKQVLQFIIVKAGQAEIKACLLQVGKLERQQVLIPRGPIGRFIRQEAKCLDLRFTQFVGENDWDTVQLQPTSSLQSQMTVNHKA